MMILQMTVYKIVQVHLVALRLLMNVVFVKVLVSQMVFVTVVDKL